jgi:hypothetical protein
MEERNLHKLLNLRPGEFYRMHSGFFQGLPGGAIAFLPSIFRLPWHQKKPHIVNVDEIMKILRAESIELITLVVLFIILINFFFFEILDFYTALFNGDTLLAMVAHAVSMAILVLAVVLLNNAPLFLAVQPHGRRSARRRWRTIEGIAQEMAARTQVMALVADHRRKSCKSSSVVYYILHNIILFIHACILIYICIYFNKREINY